MPSHINKTGVKTVGNEKTVDSTATQEEDEQMATSSAKPDASTTNDAKATRGGSRTMSAARATVIAGAIMATAAISVPFLNHLIPTWLTNEEQTLLVPQVQVVPPEPVVDQDSDQTLDEVATATPIFRTEQVEFLDGAQMQVCDEYWISAIPKFDSSSGTNATSVITLPDGTEVPFRASGGEPILIAPGCTVIGSRLRENRPNDPDTMLTIRQEIN